jgi:hypothetical protein
MKSLIDISQVVNDVSKKADEVLEGVGPGPFSIPAYDMYRGKIGQYIDDLYRESSAIAKHQEADVISAKHVEAAAERLTLSPQGRFRRHLGIGSGLFLGSSISTLGSMVVADAYPLSGIILTLITGIVGAFFFGMHVMRE